MADMSRAIRLTIEQHSGQAMTELGQTLAALDDDTLRQFTTIVGAFYVDLRDELKSRPESETA